MAQPDAAHLAGQDEDLVLPIRAGRLGDWMQHSTVKDLDKLYYMQQQVDLAGLPAPRAIGIDEISIRKGHNYRVIVSDLGVTIKSGVRTLLSG
jgi:hypothetical protein